MAEGKGYYLTIKQIDQIDVDLEFISSFCGIIESLGDKDGFKDVNGKDIVTLAATAIAKVMDVKSEITRIQERKEAQNGKEE